LKNKVSWSKQEIKLVIGKINCAEGI